MGILRLLLALNVVIAHAGGNLFKITSIGGVMAVETFFMISGFYMCLILSEKYKGLKNYGLFISNRTLRLYPIYYIVLILTVACFFIFNKIGINAFAYDYWIENFDLLSPFPVLFILLTLISIVGQDILCFITTNASGNFIFTENFFKAPLNINGFNFLPQAWTLSLEMMFYFMAPFLVKLKTKYLLVIAIFALLLRFKLYSMGFNHDPWNYRFFPLEIMFFIIGMVSYRLYTKHLNFNLPVNTGRFIVFTLITYLILFQYIPIEYHIQKWSFYTAMIFLIPILFNITKENKFDREIGELSYPVYIGHLLIINILNLLLPHNPKYLPLLAIGLSIIFALCLNKYIANPIELYRQKRICKNDTAINEFSGEININIDIKQMSNI